DLVAAQSDIGRTEVQRHDLGQAGREVVQVRVDFALGAAFGAHTHPGEEIAYVLEGTRGGGAGARGVRSGAPLRRAHSPGRGDRLRARRHAGVRAGGEDGRAQGG